MRPSVWPPPRSLATTSGISVDVFSSPYLDVSVQAVPHVHLFDSMHVTGVLLQWVSPFGNLRIIGYLLLPEAYRSLSRPSSAPDAKAFPLRSFQLDLSNHLLILKVELCRQFNRIFEIVIVTHLYDVPQLKLKIRSFKLYVQKTSLLPCLSLLHYIVQFSRFDLPTAFAARFEDLSYARSSNPTTTVVWWARVGSNHRPYDYQSYALAS